VWWCQPKVDIVVAESSLGAKLLREDHAIKLDERRIESRQVLICLGGQRVAIQLPLSFHAQVLLPVSLVGLWMGGYVWLRVDVDMDVDVDVCARHRVVLLEGAGVATVAVHIRFRGAVVGR
jgi:hypothetical protein